MIKIQISETFTDRDGCKYYAGEIRYVSEENAERFCSAGWARDTEGKVPDGRPDMQPQTLQVANVVMDHSAKEPT